MKENCAAGFLFAGGFHLLGGAKGIQLGGIGADADSGDDFLRLGGNGDGFGELLRKTAGVFSVNHGTGEVQGSVSQPCGPILTKGGGGVRR